MTRGIVLVVVLALIAQTAMAEPRDPGETASASVNRIGVYDSRAVAVAFVGSEVYKATAGKELDEMLAERKKAKAERDRKRAVDLKARGKAQQDLLHKQGFSTAPVDDILAHISDQLPAIKKDADVDRLVSKWDEKTLAECDSAERVDVTMRLIDAFKPTQRQKQSAIDVQKHEPVPLEKMKRHRH